MFDDLEKRKYKYDKDNLDKFKDLIILGIDSHVEKYI